MPQAVQRHRVQHEWFERVASGACPGPDSPPPCMSDAEDWETHSSWWAAELDQRAAEQAQAAVAAGASQAAMEPGGSHQNARHTLVSAL